MSDAGVNQVLSWKVVKSVTTPEGNLLATFSGQAPLQRTGSYVAIRAAWEGEGEEPVWANLGLVSAPGEPATVVVACTRWVPSSLRKALETEGSDVHCRNEELGDSTLRVTDVVPFFVFNCGVSFLGFAPLIGLLRCEPHAESKPHLFWVVHSEEELQHVAGCLDALPPPCKEGATAVATVVVCNPKPDNMLRLADSIRQARADGATRVVVHSQGVDIVPSLIRRTIDESGMKSVGVETIGCKELHQQLKERISVEWSEEEELPRLVFGCQKSFGYVVPKKDPWAEHEPWPVTSWLPPFSLLPWGVGKSRLGLQDWLYLRTDPLGLALFRAAFGYLCFTFAYKMLQGRAERDHVGADMRFKYDYMEFLGPDLPEPYCYYMYYAMGLASLGIMLGWPYRLSSLVFTITFVWHFFVEATHYNNHYYLMFSVGMVLLCVNANSCLVFDPIKLARRWLGYQTQDRVSVKPMPYINHFFLRGTVLFVFFYGFIAKLNNDWISGHVMRSGIEDEVTIATWLVVELATFFLSWGGVVYDMIGPLWFCHNSLRFLALGGFITFNVMNMFLFNIGVFPWMMLGSIPLLIETHTPRRQFRVIGSWLASLSDRLTWQRLPSVEHRVRKAGRWVGNRVLKAFPPFTDSVYILHQHESYRSMPLASLRPSCPSPMYGYSRTYRCLMALFLVLLLTFHSVYPLRNWWYHWGSDQQVAWTEHGRKFSWHMMSRHKNCGGHLQVVHEGLRLDQQISVNQTHYTGPIRLHHHQIKKLTTIATYVRQLCWKTRKFYENLFITQGKDIETTEDEARVKDPQKIVKIYAHVWCSCNGSPRQPFIDPSYDLSRQFPPQPPGKLEPWILPQKKFGPPGYPNLYPYKLSTSEFYKRTVAWFSKVNEYHIETLE